MGARALVRESRGRGHRLVAFTTALVLALAMLPVFADVARADEVSPELLSFSRTSVDVLGGDETVVVEFAARDEGPAGLSYANFYYSTPTGFEVRVDSPYMNRSSAGTFFAAKPLSFWAASGEYLLEKITLTDREHNRSTYTREGSPQFDFAAADFVVDNPREDITTPTIKSISLFREDVAQGTPVIVLYEADDDSSGVEEVYVTGRSPSGSGYVIRSLTKLGAVGPATWVVPLTSPSGIHSATGITVMDRAGNFIEYRIGQSPRPFPPKVTIPPHNPPDPATLSFRVHGSPGDAEPPLMTSFKPIVSKTRHLGDLAGFDYSAVDAGSGVVQVAAQWEDGSGHSFRARKRCGDRSTGPLSSRIEDFRTIGSQWTLQHISLTDGIGNTSYYYPNGDVSTDSKPDPESSHSFDLSSADFRIESGPPSDDDVPGPTGLDCPFVPTVDMDVETIDGVYGEVVTLSGSVSGDVGPVADPMVALHEYVQGTPRLVGIAQGDGHGWFARTFSPVARAQVAATFLGAAGPYEGITAESSPVDVMVRPRLVGHLNKRRVQFGRRVRLSGRIDPGDTSGPLVLQRLTTGGWIDRESAEPVPDGGFSFTFRPGKKGRHRYRVVRQEDARFGFAKSRAHVIKVIARS